MAVREICFLFDPRSEKELYFMYEKRGSKETVEILTDCGVAGYTTDGGRDVVFVALALPHFVVVPVVSDRETEHILDIMADTLKHATVVKCGVADGEEV